MITVAADSSGRRLVWMITVAAGAEERRILWMVTVTSLPMVRGGSAVTFESLWLLLGGRALSGVMAGS
jgi:hypothetical protein